MSTEQLEDAWNSISAGEHCQPTVHLEKSGQDGEAVKTSYLMRRSYNRTYLIQKRRLMEYMVVLFMRRETDFMLCFGWKHRAHGWELKESKWRFRVRKGLLTPRAAPPGVRHTARL